MNIFFLSRWCLLWAPLFVLISSCSIFQAERKLYLNSNFSEHSTSLDWEYQLNDFQNLFIQKYQLIKLNSQDQSYLHSLLEKILKSLPFEVDQNFNPQIFLVKDAEAYSMSFPNGSIFLSTRLLSRFIQSESFLASILSFELVRCVTKAYRRQVYYPKGYITKDSLLELMSLPNHLRMEIHKWAVTTIDNAGFDINEYLNWIQSLNRYYKEFSKSIESLKSIVSEESQLKAFLIKHKENSLYRVKDVRKSPKEFFQLINRF
ncbi:MAG: hypothetical protein H6620_11575 [Halobacteriovoraceae bacterium]|nr:hypothetical protein [Halobacteriovoraceae bacterium]